MRNPVQEGNNHVNMKQNRADKVRQKHLILSCDIFLGIKLQYSEVFFFLLGYVEERPWWPIQSPNKGRKKKASS